MLKYLLNTTLIENTTYIKVLITYKISYHGNGIY